MGRTSRTLWLLAAWVVIQPAPLLAQAVSQVDSSRSRGSSSASTRAAGERPVSLELLVPNIAHDQKPVWFFPLRVLKGQHLKPTLSLIFTTAGLVALDAHDTPYFRRSRSFVAFNTAMSGRNTALAMVILPALFYAAGLARKEPSARQTGLLAAEAAADSEILSLVMKNIDRRLRPSDIPLQGDFSHTWFKSHGTVLTGRGASFPSGHAIAAFSLATLFVDRYKDHRWVPWVAYGAAGLVGFSRITLQAHFPSDVFAGATLGYAISHYVVLRH